MNVLLPNAAVSKLDALDQSAKTHQATARNLAELLNSKQQLLSQAMSAGDQQKKVRAIEIEINEIKEKQLAARHRCDNDRSSATRCRSFLAQLSLNGGYADLSPVTIKPRLAKGEALADAIEALRGEIAEKQAELRTVRAAPLAVDDLAEAASVYVNKLAKDAAVRVSGADGRQPIGLTYSNVDPLALIAWVMPEAISNAIVREVRKQSAGGVSAAEKARRIDTLTAAILQKEHVEEALVVMAQARSESILRRNDADPRAILGVELANDQREVVAA